MRGPLPSPAADTQLTPFRFILLALAAYRITRFFTNDVWPPVARAREWLEKHSDYFSEMFSCPWCVGLFVTAAVFLADYHLVTPISVLAAVAAMTIVGMIGKFDE